MGRPGEPAGAEFHGLLELLAEGNATATCFVVGYFAKRFPQLVREAVPPGMRSPRTVISTAWSTRCRPFKFTRTRGRRANCWRM